MPQENHGYKDSLNLPKTSFSMRSNLPKSEPDRLAEWERIGIYQKLREKKGRKQFTLHDGPPYANGHLHIGHALNKIIKDMIVRSHQMMGYDSRFVPGWDCHGLPIEWKVEEQYRAKNLDKSHVSVNEFRGKCRDFAREWVDIQREEFKRLGVMGNWDHPYLTMDFHAEKVIAEEFMKFAMNGTLYQGSRPVMWSPVEQTALAEAEVEYKEKKSPMIWVKFSVSGTGDEEFDSAFVVIWTTTPWTIPSNMGVTYHRDIPYGLYEVVKTPDECWACIGDRYILADNLAPQTMKRARLEEGMYRRLRDVSADDLSRMNLSHPLKGADEANGEWDTFRDFRHADFVSGEEGTGFVHCAPSHGMEEYELYRQSGDLENMLVDNVNIDGSFRHDLPFFGGKMILRPNGKEGDANQSIIDKLVEMNGLLARGVITHDYPHSWRSRAPLIYLNRPQWFVALDKDLQDGQDEYGMTIRQRALAAIKDVRWWPKSGENRLSSMVASRPDWTLSRQRAWGVPLTCFVKKDAVRGDADFLLRDERVNQRILDAFEAEGADCWYADGAKARFLEGIVNPDEYEQVMDILDVWFDSGSTHAFVLRDREDGTEDGVADLYMEGSDQHRGWFQSSLLQSVGTSGRAPYRQVVTHGMTLDEKGRKMSKSIGNTISPHDIVKQYGADILRLWVARVDHASDQRIGPKILQGVVESYRRLRNTMRFILGSLPTSGDVENVVYDDLPELERWVLHRLYELDLSIRHSYRSFDFQDVFTKISTFATNDLSSFYLDIRKDSLYCDGNSLEAKSARYILNILHQRLAIWCAPILAFTMDEVWQTRGYEDSVHLQDFPEKEEKWYDYKLAAKWDMIRQIRHLVTSALEVEREKKEIGSSLEAHPVLHVNRGYLVDILKDVPLDDICITSGMDMIHGCHRDNSTRLDDLPYVSVTFRKAKGHKCERCWKVKEDIGEYRYPSVCGRCNHVLEEMDYPLP